MDFPLYGQVYLRISDAPIGVFDRGGGSFEYPHHMFGLKNKNIYLIINYNLKPCVQHRNYSYMHMKLCRSLVKSGIFAKFEYTNPLSIPMSRSLNHVRGNISKQFPPPSLMAN